MPSWSDALSEAALSGSLAALASAAVLAAAGARQTPSAAAPVNAASQWLWGEHDAQQADHPDTRHTGTGYLVHHLAAGFWAVLHARALGDRPEMSRPLPALGAAAVTGAVAALVDLKLTPERFTPGFQHRVSTGALVATYGAFALGLGMGSLLVRRRREHRTPSFLRRQEPMGPPCTPGRPHGPQPALGRRGGLSPRLAGSAR